MPRGERLCSRTWLSSGKQHRAQPKPGTQLGFPCGAAGSWAAAVDASPWAGAWLPLAVLAFRGSKNRLEYCLCLLGGPPGLEMQSFKNKQFFPLPFPFFLLSLLHNCPSNFSASEEIQI